MIGIFQRPINPARVISAKTLEVAVRELRQNFNAVQVQRRALEPLAGMTPDAERLLAQYLHREIELLDAVRELEAIT